MDLSSGCLRAPWLPREYKPNDGVYLWSDVSSFEDACLLFVYGVLVLREKCRLFEDLSAVFDERRSTFICQKKGINTLNIGKHSSIEMSGNLFR